MSISTSIVSERDHKVKVKSARNSSKASPFVAASAGYSQTMGGVDQHVQLLSLHVLAFLSYSPL